MWHLPSAHKTSHAQLRKEEPTESFFFFFCFSKNSLSLNSVVRYEWKRSVWISVPFFPPLLAGIVRGKLSCVWPLVAQSRCPNQFPQHFLLSTVRKLSFTTSNTPRLLCREHPGRWTDNSEHFISHLYSVWGEKVKVKLEQAVMTAPELHNPVFNFFYPPYSSRRASCR